MILKQKASDSKHTFATGIAHAVEFRTSRESFRVRPTESCQSSDLHQGPVRRALHDRRKNNGDGIRWIHRRRPRPLSWI